MSKFITLFIISLVFLGGCNRSFYVMVVKTTNVYKSAPIDVNPKSLVVLGVLRPGQKVMVIDVINNKDSKVYKVSLEETDIPEKIGYIYHDGRKLRFD